GGFGRGSGLLRSSDFSSDCLRVNQKNGLRQVCDDSDFDLPSKSKKSEKQGLKERSKSALMQCLRHSARQVLRPRTPKRSALAQIKSHGIKRATSSGALHGHLPLSRQSF
ncbi:hypothetical protein, partial [Xanthomonas hortorum]|uniref:hypothetical protein n=1 Tax=Xanthomonas hortorum TaxID=56454 RepID=UPI001F22314B